MGLGFSFGLGLSYRKIHFAIIRGRFFLELISYVRYLKDLTRTALSEVEGSIVACDNLVSGDAMLDVVSFDYP
jgi:hypothetical protein